MLGSSGGGSVVCAVWIVAVGWISIDVFSWLKAVVGWVRFWGIILFNSGLILASRAEGEWLLESWRRRVMAVPNFAEG